jgi:gas vesicle protein
MGKGTGFLSFIAGAVFGAVLALLYAPTSGEELRAQIRDEADIRLQKASEEWTKALENVQTSIDEMGAEVKTYLDQLAKKEELESGEADVNVDVEVAVDEA